MVTVVILGECRIQLTTIFLFSGSLTQLYRESLEGMRLGTEGVRRSGYQKCRRDLASWASLHRRRYIRRDELLSLLVIASYFFLLLQ